SDKRRREIITTELRELALSSYLSRSESSPSEKILIDQNGRILVLKILGF
ncbi:unnamed protein product, partial [Arabidopsis halleri]